MVNTSNKLIACFVELSSNRERTALEHSVVKTLSQMLECSLYLLQLYDSRGVFKPDIRFWLPINDADISSKPSLIDEPMTQALADYVSIIDTEWPNVHSQQVGKVFWPLYVNGKCLDVLILERTELAVDELHLLEAIGAIFTNFMELLEVGERDALTSLYNRRVFDTRLNALSTVDQRDGGRRRSEIGDEEDANFLGIIDIDYFKRVNDDFGHLFGDEVLLWLAQKMRECFRNEDALFRYGGEEFAVLLSGLTQQQASDTFERFRRSIADTNFPQIGQVTVSIGFTTIDAQANPTLVFGMADKALYYAKEHGRNRVDCFETLVQNKLIDDHDEDHAEIELF